MPAMNCTHPEGESVLDLGRKLLVSTFVGRHPNRDDNLKRAHQGRQSGTFSIQSATEQCFNSASRLIRRGHRSRLSRNTAYLAPVSKAWKFLRPSRSRFGASITVCLCRP